MVISLELGADLHMSQLMPLPLTVSCFSKIQIGFTFLVPAHPGTPEKRPLNMGACVRGDIQDTLLKNSRRFLCDKPHNVRKQVKCDVYKRACDDELHGRASDLRSRGREFDPRPGMAA